MSPDFIDKWEHILEDIEKNKIPVEFIKKLIIKLYIIPLFIYNILHILLNIYQ